MMESGHLRIRRAIIIKDEASTKRRAHIHDTFRIFVGRKKRLHWNEKGTPTILILHSGC